MDNITQLFIRAAKTGDSLIRLESVYKRFYGNYGYVGNMMAISNLLIHIVDEVHPMKLSEFLREADRYRQWDSMTEEDTPPYMTNLYIARDRLRHLMKPDMVEMGMRVPARWRNK